MSQSMSLDEAKSLPVWKQPVTLLFLMAATMPIAFYAWYALLNNFVIEIANFDATLEYCTQFAKFRDFWRFL